MMERKYRRILTRKVIPGIRKIHRDKLVEVERQQKLKEESQKKLAQQVGKMIMNEFWEKIKMVSEVIREQKEAAEMKKQLDADLDDMVNQTQKFSHSVVQNLHRPSSPASSTSSKKTASETMSTADSRAASDYELSDEDSDASASIASDEEDHSEDELRQLEDQQDDDLLEIYAKLYGHKIPEKQEIKEEEKEIKEEITENPEKKPKLELEALEKIIDEKSITPDLPESPKDEKTENLNKITNTARSMLPTGLTLGENHVKTPIPSLMKGKLRDYQHIGLDWLVSLHDQDLNGILADEMGLGKTIQTISLLAHLAVNQGQWGPHLVVVPTSVLLNWDLEFKKWFPGFKVIAYYGSQKERKEKRRGWSRENMFHCVITSYNLVIQDQRMFKRKDWNYLILDEAHNIKNWMSQRWQTLLGFKSEHRLLLTGTPLQNDLLELWALLHFLMPDLFESRKGFSEWFHRPIGDMVEGSVEYNKKLVERLHKVLRPFLLRRLKSEVEKQMPKKYEHVVYCHLSKRQRALYEDYICRTDTQERMKCGGYIGIIGVIMNLRKVCNHPDLLEPRPVESPFLLPRLSLSLPRICQSILTHNHARGFTGRLWQRLPTTGYALHIRARTELSIFNTFTINKLDASKEYYNLYISEHQKYAKKKPPKGYEWLAFRRQQKNKSKYKTMYSTNRNRCSVLPAPSHFAPENVRQLLNVPMLQVIQNVSFQKSLSPISNVLRRKISCYCSPAEAPVPVLDVSSPMYHIRESEISRDISESTKFIRAKTHDEDLARRVQLPETRLIQYDCGKLQTLHDLIYQKLKPNGHRALIFTQMTKMLDVLERFLSYHALTYSRLDGSTAPEKRIQIMETFNRDPKIFCMILSTRSGGVGVNLTGADTVIFYDSDWNPTIDAQAQDRAHRIGQTRDVHIYRFIAKDTIEENILKKANYKRKLGNVAIEEGRFNIEGLKEDQLRVLIQGKEDDDDESEEPSSEEPESSENVKNNLAAVEDADDQEAAKVILDEVDEDEEEFQEESDDDIEDKLTPLEQKSLSWFLEDQARTIAEEEAQKAEETRIRKMKEEAKAKATPPVLPKEFQTNKRSKRIDKRLKHERAMENELKRCRRTDSDFYDDSDEEGYTPVRRKSYQTRAPKPPARRGRPPNSAKDKMAVSEQPKTTSPKRTALPRDNSNLRLNKVEVQFVACNPRRLSSAQIPPSEPDW